MVKYMEQQLASESDFFNFFLMSEQKNKIIRMDEDIIMSLENMLLSYEHLRLFGYSLKNTSGEVRLFIDTKLIHPKTKKRRELFPGHNINGTVYYGRIPAPFSTDPNFIYHQNNSVERQCVRCDRSFYMTSYGEYLKHEQCQYHWGKLYQMGNTNKYTCCKGSSNSNGCAKGQYHVWNGFVEGWNGPFAGFRQTSTADLLHSDGDFGVYALDCEMCYTANGLEVTKVTVVRFDGQLVYDFFVKPDKPIIDYNTRFSGITSGNFSDPNYVKSLNEVQNDLLSFINKGSILIGHGLNNDLRALKIVHHRVIDTSILFPHHDGFPFRRSLKGLAKTILQRSIQDISSGHDSEEDARTCLQLVITYILTEFNKNPIENNNIIKNLEFLYSHVGLKSPPPSPLVNNTVDRVFEDDSFTSLNRFGENIIDPNKFYNLLPYQLHHGPPPMLYSVNYPPTHFGYRVINQPMNHRKIYSHNYVNTFQ